MTNLPECLMHCAETGLKHQPPKDSNVIRAEVCVKVGDCDVAVMIEVASVIHAFTCMSVKLPKGVRGDEAVVIHRANDGFRVGKDKISLDDGEVLFHMTIPSFVLSHTSSCIQSTCIHCSVPWRLPCSSVYGCHQWRRSGGPINQSSAILDCCTQRQTNVGENHPSLQTWSSNPSMSVNKCVHLNHSDFAAANALDT